MLRDRDQEKTKVEMWFGMRAKQRPIRRVLFGCVSSMNFVMCESIYSRLAQDERVECWLTGMHDGKDNPWPLYAGFGVAKERIIREKDAKRKAYDAYIASDYHLVEGAGRVKVQLFHTLSFRRFFIGPLARNFDTLFLWGPYMRQQFADSGMFEYEDPRMEEIGCPALDRLVDGSLKRKDVREKLGVSGERPVVLLAPCFLPYGALRWGESLLIELLKLPVTLLVKLHELSFSRRIGSTNWDDVLKKLSAAHENLRVYTDADPAEVLLASDIMVTDVSAMAYQQMLLDRPVVFLDVPEDELRQGYPNLDSNWWGLEGGVRIKDPAGLESAILDQLAHPERLRVERQRIAKEAFFDPGHATDRAVSRIYELMNLSPSPETTSVVS